MKTIAGEYVTDKMGHVCVIKCNLDKISIDFHTATGAWDRAQGVLKNDRIEMAFYNQMQCRTKITGTVMAGKIMWDNQTEWRKTREYPAVDTTIDLGFFEKRVFSQNGEDGIIEAIFANIGTTNKYYLEFGVQDATECNSRYLREVQGWSGLMWDGGFENPAIHLFQEFITRENILALCEKYQVPAEFDLLVVDIDYNDWYIWRQISLQHKPRVVVVEHNATHLPGEDMVVKYDPKMCWDTSNYFGASLTAFQHLADHLGYSLVYVDNMGVNAFFVRDDVVQQAEKAFVNINDVAKLSKKPKYGQGPNGGHAADVKKRPYLSSGELLHG